MLDDEEMGSDDDEARRRADQALNRRDMRREDMDMLYESGDEDAVSIIYTGEIRCLIRTLFRHHCGKFVMEKR